MNSNATTKKAAPHLYNKIEKKASKKKVRRNVKAELRNLSR